jgi:hypothetical protein
VIDRISQNGTLYNALVQRTQQALNLAHIADSATGSSFLPDLVREIQPNAGAPVQSVPPQSAEPSNSESHVTKNARQRVAEATAPR